MEFRELADFFDELENTPKRLGMTDILVRLYNALDPEEVESATYMLQGKVAPDWLGLEFGLAEKLVLQGIARAAGLQAKTGGGTEAVQQLYHEAGDLGGAAERALASATVQKQTGLDGFGDASADAPTDHAVFGAADTKYERGSIRATFAKLGYLASSQGKGSQGGKIRLLEELLRGASGKEARYLVRIVAGRLRLGVADMTVLDALAHIYRHAAGPGRAGGATSVTEMAEDERAQYEAGRAAIERAFDACSDLARVAKHFVAGMTGGKATAALQAMEAIHIEHGVPLRPMAAERLKTVGEIIAKHGGRTAVEYKYDGLRLQCHVSPGGVRIFSRRMEELTDQFPDVQALLRSALQGKECVVEGECVAVDAEGRMRPFQELSRRRGRKTGLGEEARTESVLAAGGQKEATVMDDIPVAVYLFDCLSISGESIMDKPYQSTEAAKGRRDHLGDLFRMEGRVLLSTMKVCDDEASVEEFFQQAVQDGAEGIMCKALDAPYKAGNRGFAWIKYKTDYTEELVDTMDLVAVGAFYGRGRRAGWYGALLMAARDGNWFSSVCKLGTGFDDATLMGLKDRFAPHASAAKPSNVDSEMKPDVWFDPKVVMEVQAAELTLSPIHRAGWSRLREGAGLAARFPRFTRWRDDKSPEQATAVDELVTMYEAQGA